jgi:hypothetical protein
MQEKLKERWAHAKATLLERRITQDAISADTGVPQSTVSRFLARCPRRASRAFNTLCNYALRKKSVEAKPDPGTSDELMSAMRNIWNGTEEHARALADILRAVEYAVRVTKP